MNRLALIILLFSSSLSSAGIIGMVFSNYSSNVKLSVLTKKGRTVVTVDVPHSLNCAVHTYRSPEGAVFSTFDPKEHLQEDPANQIPTLYLPLFYEKSCLDKAYEDKNTSWSVPMKHKIDITQEVLSQERIRPLADDFMNGRFQIGLCLQQSGNGAAEQGQVCSKSFSGLSSKKEKVIYQSFFQPPPPIVLVYKKPTSVDPRETIAGLDAVSNTVGVRFRESNLRIVMPVLHLETKDAAMNWEVTNAHLFQFIFLNGQFISTARALELENAGEKFCSMSILVPLDQKDVAVIDLSAYAGPATTGSGGTAHFSGDHRVGKGIWGTNIDIHSYKYLGKAPEQPVINHLTCYGHAEITTAGDVLTHFQADGRPFIQLLHQFGAVKSQMEAMTKLQ